MGFSVLNLPNQIEYTFSRRLNSYLTNEFQNASNIISSVLWSLLPL